VPAARVRPRLASFLPVPAAATALVAVWVVLAASEEWGASAEWAEWAVLAASVASVA